MSVAARLAIWQLLPLGGVATVTPDYDVDESDVFRARQRSTRFDGQRYVLSSGAMRSTLFQADTGKTERA